MRTILILLLSIFLLTGCYREIREEIKLIDESVPVSVVEYGANGSDCEDDSEAFQAALNEHGVVFVPSGLYYIDTTIVFNHNMKLIGEGIPGRYPDTSAFGTAIYIGENVETLFEVNGYGVEIIGMSFTGTGQNLETIIDVQYGGGNLLFKDILERDIQWYAGGWQKSPYTFLRFSGTSNTIIVDRLFSYSAHWAIRLDAPVYFFTMKNGRIFGTDNGVYIGGKAVSFRCANYAMEQIVGPAFQIGANGWADMHFENIHNEWAWPFILNEAINRPVINIDGMYGWGYEGEEINLIENTSKGSYISVKNSVLYNTRGYKPDDDFPIKDWAKYSYGVTLDNVKIKDQESHKYRVWNKFPSEGLEAVDKILGARLYFHKDNYTEGDTLSKLIPSVAIDNITLNRPPIVTSDNWIFDDSTLITVDGDWSFLGNSNATIVAIARADSQNIHTSTVFNTGTTNGIRLVFDFAKFTMQWWKDGVKKAQLGSGGLPPGLTFCFVYSQEKINDSLHVRMCYDNYGGYTHHHNFDIVKSILPIATHCPETTDHDLYIGDGEGESLDGRFYLLKITNKPISDEQMYEIIYSTKKHYGWQHSNLGLF